MTDVAHFWAALPQIGNIHASADGNWAYFTQSGPHETDEVYAVPCDASAPPTRLTHGEDHFLIRDVSPDGNRLILAQSRHACEHDHLLLLDRATRVLTLLTPVQSSHYLYGGRFTQDGKAIIFCTDYDYGTETVIEGGMVWHQNLATGTRTRLARTDHFFDIPPRVSPDGGKILLNLNDRKPGSTQLWVMASDGADLTEVLCLGETNNTRGDWIDADRIAFVTDHLGRDRLGVLTLSTGQIDWLAGEPDVFPHQIVPGTVGHFAVICHDQSRSFAMVHDGTALRVQPNHSGRRSLVPHARLPDGGWLAEAYDASAPHQLVRVLPDGTCLELTGAARFSTPHIPQDFRWTAPDGRPCQGWLYPPEGPSNGFIAYIHGGPTWHSEDWVNPKVQFWVASGFTVLDPNYRGSTGFGYAQREAVKEDGWGGREQADIRAGIEAAVVAGFASPGRIAVAGNSYGGFSSWFAITHHADLVTAAIPMCGMYRLDIDYHQTEMPHGRAYSEEMMGGTPEQFPEKYANAGPGNFIDQIRGHVMIVHGLADSNVGPENTHTAVRELTAAGIPHQVMLFENEGHGVFRRSNAETYLAASAAFLIRAFEGTDP